MAKDKTLKLVCLKLDSIRQKDGLLEGLKRYNDQFTLKDQLIPNEDGLLWIHPLALRHLWSCIDLNEFEKFKLRKEILAQLRENNPDLAKTYLDLIESYLRDSVFQSSALS